MAPSRQDHLWPGARSWAFIDRRDWIDGPWLAEAADKIYWVDPPTQLPCIMRRNKWGAWCGYVAVDADHPMHGIRDEHSVDLEVHGGVTYARPCDEGGPEHKAVCHDADGGRSVWWFGFDCSHAFDLCRVSCDEQPLSEHGVYRDVPYVKAEVESLARQLHAQRR